MRKSFLGRTGLEISEIAFGGGDTGGLLIRGDETACVTTLTRAVKAGINWIDTAALYGNGASEEAIGRYVGALSPQPQISTKVRIEYGDLPDLRGAIERSLTESLERLRTDRVALFQLHNQLGEAVGGRLGLPVEDVLGRGGVADIFSRLKEQGLFQASGITAAGETKACLDVINSGRFDCAQVYYNALNPSAAWKRAPQSWSAQDFSGIMAACWNQNMGVLAIRVLAGGPLASSKRPEKLAVLTSGTNVDNEMRCAAAVHRVLGLNYGTPAQAALRFVLGNRDFATRVIGISSFLDLNEALIAVEQGPLPAAAITALKELWATDFRG
jgi:L-galactose dehydrogenase/L-glyceraldehyde 3-phosphate reductase